jgi:hypothetical protein
MSKMLGTSVGGEITSAPEPIRRYLGMALLPAAKNFFTAAALRAMARMG